MKYSDDEKTFQQVDALLHKRKAAPEMPSGMVDRIMRAAGSQPVRGRWLDIVRDSFLLPQPALAFGLLLLGGVFVGMEMESFWTVLGEDWTGFLYINEDLI